MTHGVNSPPQNDALRKVYSITLLWWSAVLLGSGKPYSPFLFSFIASIIFWFVAWYCWKRTANAASSPAK